ncbi:MAG: YkvA family protein [Microcoleaceae cyanobacterium]
MKNPVQSFYNWYRETLRNTKYRWILVLGTLVYLLSPIDIAPDFIPFMGWIDDGIIAALLVTEVSQLMLEGLNRRSKAGVNEKTTVADATVINVEVG